MKTLILGSSGKIGKFFIKKNNDLIYTFFKNKISGGVKFDINKNNVNKLLGKHNINKAIILSSYSDPDYCYKNKKKSYLLNVISTKKIINQFIKKNIYFIFFSSEFVYCGKKNNYNEKSYTKPFTIYGKQKLLVEKYIKKKTNNFAIFRIAKTYSDSLDQKDFFSNFFYLLKKKNYSFNAASDQIFNPLYINDVVKISNYLIKKKIRGLFNVGGPKSYSRYACVKILRKHLPNSIRNKVKIKKVKMKAIITKEKRPLNLSMNVSKLKKIYGFKTTKFEKLAKIAIKRNFNGKYFDSR